MPRLRSSEPPKDPIKALILERKNAMRLSDKELSKRLGICRQTCSRLMNTKHTDDWSLGEIKKICRSLNIPVEELKDAVRYR